MLRFGAATALAPAWASVACTRSRSSSQPVVARTNLRQPAPSAAVTLLQTAPPRLASNAASARGSTSGRWPEPESGRPTVWTDHPSRCSSSVMARPRGPSPNTIASMSSLLSWGSRGRRRSIRESKKPRSPSGVRGPCASGPGGSRSVVVSARRQSLGTLSSGRAAKASASTLRGVAFARREYCAYEATYATACGSAASNPTTARMPSHLSARSSVATAISRTPARTSTARW